MAKYIPPEDKEVQAFLAGKPAYSLALLDYFMEAFQEIGPVTLYGAKTMLGIGKEQQRIAWVTQLGRQFLHVVFPFTQAYSDNFCFQKIAEVPGQQQYNHHLRLLHRDDINGEVLRFMRLAYEGN